MEKGLQNIISYSESRKIWVKLHIMCSYNLFILIPLLALFFLLIPFLLKGLPATKQQALLNLNILDVTTKDA